MPLGRKVGLDPRDTVLDADPAPLRKKGTESPNFWPMSIVAKRLHGSRCHLVWRKASAYAKLCWMWTQLPLPKKGAQPLPQLLAHVYCAQTAGWIKMPLAMEVGVGLDPSNIVLDGDPAPPPQKEGRAPQFLAHAHCGQMAAWIKMPLGMEVDSPGHIVLNEDPAPLLKRGTAPNFWPMFVVAKRLDGPRCHLVQW